MSLVLLADGLTRIRNGQASGLESVKLRFSKFVYAVLNVMLEQGYLESCEILEENGFKFINVKLAYHGDFSKPVIKIVRMVSKPGCKVYSSIKNLDKFFNGLGIKILSTSEGIITDGDARKLGIGGKVLCEIF